MTTLPALLLITLSLTALPAMAHVGPDAMDQHFIEHLLIALVVGLPAGYALFRLLSPSKQNRD